MKTFLCEPPGYMPAHTVDDWIQAIPENPYDLCPCGCGQKFKFVAKDAKSLEEHEQRFYAAHVAANPPTVSR